VRADYVWQGQSSYLKGAGPLVDLTEHDQRSGCGCRVAIELGPGGRRSRVGSPGRRSRRWSA